jgi:hypothetical protein
MSDILVCPRGEGGFANKLFQVAAAMAVARRVGGRVLLCRSKWVASGPSYQRAHHDDFDEAFGAFEKADAFEPTVQIRERPCAHKAYLRPLFETIAVASIRRPCSLLMRGFFHNAAHIDDHIVRELDRKLALPRPAARPMCIFIHIRLGDYVSSSAFSFDLQIYYSRAAALLKHLLGRPAEFAAVVFTDDSARHPLLRRYMDAMSLEDFARVHVECGGDPYEAMQQMRACGGGGICAPSTFSWWAARLSAVDAPERRFAMPCMFSNYLNVPLVHAEYAFAQPPTLTIVPVW